MHASAWKKKFLFLGLAAKSLSFIVLSENNSRTLYENNFLIRSWGNFQENLVTFPSYEKVNYSNGQVST